jgi:CheY-like chemotaxis protein
MKILYVKDNDDNVYMLKNRLTRAGRYACIVLSAASPIVRATLQTVR